MASLVFGLMHVPCHTDIAAVHTIENRNMYTCSVYHSMFRGRTEVFVVEQFFVLPGFTEP